ncbi:hypothetical protein GCM10008933_28800 [Paenibacillus motobuensis]|uniref:Uncharacterized protein n=1 Tax=Paenibacillus motobuensis TaxID=295324 RepID=A0ABN0YJM9_9BACL
MLATDVAQVRRLRRADPVQRAPVLEPILTQDWFIGGVAPSVRQLGAIETLAAGQRLAFGKL